MTDQRRRTMTDQRTMTRKGDDDRPEKNFFRSRSAINYRRCFFVCFLVLIKDNFPQRKTSFHSVATPNLIKT